MASGFSGPRVPPRPVTTATGVTARPAWPDSPRRHRAGVLPPAPRGAPSAGAVEAELLGSDTVTEALRLSLVTSLVTTAISLVVGIPLAWVLAQGPLPGAGARAGAGRAPDGAPTGGGRGGATPRSAGAGSSGSDSTSSSGSCSRSRRQGVVLAETFVAMPFLVITVEPRCARWTPDTKRRQPLSASRWTTFRRVTLPMVAPSVVEGGAVLGLSTGRVQRDHHVRRQPRGPDPDPAPRRVPRPGTRP